MSRLLLSFFLKTLYLKREHSYSRHVFPVIYLADISLSFFSFFSFFLSFFFFFFFFSFFFFFFFFFCFCFFFFFFFFSSRRRHTSLQGDWSSDVCSSDLRPPPASAPPTSSKPWPSAARRAPRSQKLRLRSRQKRKRAPKPSSSRHSATPSSPRASSLCSQFPIADLGNDPHPTTTASPA